MNVQEFSTRYLHSACSQVLDAQDVRWITEKVPLFNALKQIRDNFGWKVLQWDAVDSDNYWKSINSYMLYLVDKSGIVVARLCSNTGNEVLFINRYIHNCPKTLWVNDSPLFKCRRIGILIKAIRQCEEFNEPSIYKDLKFNIDFAARKLNKYYDDSAMSIETVFHKAALDNPSTLASVFEAALNGRLTDSAYRGNVDNLLEMLGQVSTLPSRKANHFRKFFSDKPLTMIWIDGYDGYIAMKFQLKFYGVANNDLPYCYRLGDGTGVGYTIVDNSMNNISDVMTIVSPPTRYRDRMALLETFPNLIVPFTMMENEEHKNRRDNLYQRGFRVTDKYYDDVDVISYYHGNCAKGGWGFMCVYFPGA
jgi:hypothetical protein